MLLKHREGGVRKEYKRSRELGVRRDEQCSTPTASRTGVRCHPALVVSPARSINVRKALADALWEYTGTLSLCRGWHVLDDS
jgi:hypothetical protein